MWGVVLGRVFSPSLPAFVAFLPSFLCPDSQGCSIWESHSRELSGIDLCCESADRRSVLQTWAGIVAPWLAQQGGLWQTGVSRSGSWVPCPLRVPAAAERQCPVRLICILGASGDLSCSGIQCHGRVLVAVAENSSKELSRLLAMARENKAGAWLQLGCFPSGSLQNRSVQMETRPAAETRGGWACRRLPWRRSLSPEFWAELLPGWGYLWQSSSLPGPGSRGPAASAGWSYRWWPRLGGGFAAAKFL